MAMAIQREKIMLYVDKIKEIYSADDSPRTVYLFEKTNEDGILEYGCRYYENQIFQNDTLFPEFTEYEIVQHAKSWIEEPVSQEIINTWERQTHGES